jgi:hypothetical protein
MSATLAMPRQSDLLREEDTRFFNEHGYLALPEVAPRHEVGLIRTLLEPLFATKAGYREGAQFDLVADDLGDAPRLPQIINPHHYAASLRETQFYQTAFGIARQLLGPQARFSDDHVLLKPAHTGAPTPWHQDEAFRNPRYDYQEISIWLALQPVDRVNGCMEFIPDSQLGPVLPHRSPGGNAALHALECYTGFDESAATPCPLPAGGCTIHTGRTLHYAGPNLSDHPRYAYVLIFNVPPVPAREERSFPWLDQRQTLAEQRARAWRSRGGLAVEAMRWMRKLDLRDFDRLRYDVGRARGAVARALRRSD